MPTRLAVFINAVQTDQAVLILKDQCCQLERDSAVLALVLAIFSLIPFVAHCVYTDRITKRNGGDWPKSHY